MTYERRYLAYLREDDHSDVGEERPGDVGDGGFLLHVHV